MTPADGERETTSPRPLTALPSVQARVLAFSAIVVAGACGGLIGYSTTKVGCTHRCATPDGIGGVVGAVLAAGGVAVIVVLVLRAMGEWRSIKETHQMESMIAAAAEAAATDAFGAAEPSPAIDVGAPVEAFPIPESNLPPGDDVEPDA